MLLEFSRDGVSWTVIQRSNHYSVFVNVLAREAGDATSPRARSSKCLVTLQRQRL